MLNKNVLTIILSLLVFMFVSTTAQDKTATEKEAKKCTGTCCSSKTAEGTMDHHADMNVKSVDKNGDGKVYQCPMVCSSQLSDNAENCDKCRMKMKEVSIEQAEKALQTKHEKMENHKMETKAIDVGSIDKNKDGKVFQCPMFCTDEITDEKSNCSKCGMKTREYSMEDAEKNLKKWISKFLK